MKISVSFQYIGTIRTKENKTTISVDALTFAEYEFANVLISVPKRNIYVIIGIDRHRTISVIIFLKNL